MSGLVHWWKFAEASGNFADSVGSLTLSATGSPTYAVADPFGGTSAMTCTAAQTSSGLGSIPTGASDRTILALVKAVVTGTANKALFGYGTASTRAYFMYQFALGNGVIGDIFDLWSDSLAGQAGKAGDGDWHLVAVGIQNGRQMWLYIDGVTVGRNPNGSIVTGTGGNFSVNADAWNSVTLADVAVFSDWVGKAALDRLWFILMDALT